MAEGPHDDGSPGTDDAAWFAIVAGKSACAGCGFRPQELPARALGAQVRDDVHTFGLVLAVR